MEEDRYSHRIGKVQLSGIRKMFEKAKGDVVNLTLGEPDFSPPKHVKTAIVKAMEEGHNKYTSSQGVKDLREAIAIRLTKFSKEVTADNVMVTVGASEALFVSALTFYNAGDEILLPDPGFVVYNTESMLRLRSTCGSNIGANFDPSHLFWQGIDPIEAVRALEGCIWHVHAKDCRVDPVNARVNGVLDTKHYSDELHRSWIFRTIGYGHDLSVWRDIVSALRVVGYDDVLSIEHEDSLMGVNEGFQKAVQALKQVVMAEPTGGMWWA